MKRLLFSCFAIVGIPLLLIGFTVLAQEVGTQSTTPITTEDCENAWATASASSSCTTRVLEAEQPPGADFVSICAVKADCATSPGGAHDNFSDFHGNPDEVETLLNCSGDLKPSSC